MPYVRRYEVNHLVLRVFLGTELLVLVQEHFDDLVIAPRTGDLLQVILVHFRLPLALRQGLVVIIIFQVNNLLFAKCLV